MRKHKIIECQIVFAWYGSHYLEKIRKEHCLLTEQRLQDS